MYNTEEIQELKRLALTLNLENCKIVERYTLEELTNIYNGIGPDSFPKWLREVITTIHPSLMVVAFIHDIEWHESDSSYLNFTASNQRFVRNGVRVAKATFSWYNPRRYLVMFQAHKLGNICQMGGWSNWCSNTV